MFIGNAESIANGENTKIETIFFPTSTGVTAVPLVGAGPNGGTAYDYSSGAIVLSAGQVHGVVVCGANALAKVYDGAEGEFGQVLPPDDTGTLKQFETLGWRHIIGFGRPSENRLYRLEVGSPRQVLGI